jgi:hypothetical protein
MKKLYPGRFSMIFLVMILVIACRKSPLNSSISTDQVAFAPVPGQMNFLCTDPVYYGDSIIYLQPTGNNDYIISPLNGAALGKGIYYSWPAGLVMDSSSGDIDVSRSETGLRYIIGFVKQGSADTCLSNLIVAGVTYIDSIYVLSENDTLALPYFNGSASLASLCDSSDDSDYPGGGGGKGDGDNKCSFDGSDKSGKSAQANKNNVKVRTISGVINLKATLNDGAFGPNPVNGASITVPIYYNLNDQSKKATQVINVQLIYYDSRSDIPLATANAIETNRTDFYQNLPVLSANPRPPLLVITRKN